MYLNCDNLLQFGKFEPDRRRLMYRFIALFLFCLLLASMLPLVWSQTITASLGGTIMDPTGAAVPNAKVHIVNTATNVKIALTAGSLGEFLAPSLQPGPYSIRVEATGFKTV